MAGVFQVITTVGSDTRSGERLDVTGAKHGGGVGGGGGGGVGVGGGGVGVGAAAGSGTGWTTSGRTQRGWTGEEED